MTHSPELFVIGLDGAPWKHVEPWIDEGTVETLAAVADEGAYGPLESTIPPVTVPAWPSFATGADPGTHGVFTFYDRNTDLVDPDTVDLREIDLPFVWEELNAQGRSTLVMNFPLIHPPLDVDGAYVSGMGAPSIDEAVDSPAIADVLKDVGYKLDGWSPLHADLDALYEDFVAAAAAKFAAIDRLVERVEPDFVYCLVSETDQLQHVAFEHTDLVERFYRELDGHLADLRSTHPDSNLLLMSDHGFEPEPTLEFRPNAWLHEQGYVSYDPVRRAALSGRVFRAARPLVERVGAGWEWESDDKNDEEVLHGDGDGDERGGSLPASALSAVTRAGDAVISGVHDWMLDPLSEAPVFGYSRGIWIGDDLPDYEGVRRELVSKLRDLRYDGRPVFETVGTPEEVYGGDDLSKAPDVVWVPEPHVWITHAKLDRPFGPRKRWREGTHQNDRQGFFAFAGPAAADRPDPVPASIVDVAPTALHAMGCGVPETMVGEVKTGILATDRDPEYKSPAPIRRGSHRTTPGDDDALQEHLENLGYM